jgi:hypothetical protein
MDAERAAAAGAVPPGIHAGRSLTADAAGAPTTGQEAIA